MKAKVTWLPHRTFNNHQGAKKKAFPKQNIVFWQISLLKTVFPSLDTLCQPAGFKLFTINRYSTLHILDGAMKITCGDTAMSVKARICTQEDFGAAQSVIEERNLVRHLLDINSNENKTK